MDDFYVTLPSNVPNAPFANTSSRYVTRLPEVLQLRKDKWMVALTDLVYPHSFVNVGKPLHYWIHFKSKTPPIRLTFPSANYENLQQIVSTLNPRRVKRAAPEETEEERKKRILEFVTKKKKEDEEKAEQKKLEVLALLQKKEDDKKSEALEEAKKRADDERRLEDERRREDEEKKKWAMELIEKKRAEDAAKEAEKHRQALELVNKKRDEDETKRRREEDEKKRQAMELLAKKRAEDEAREAEKKKSEDLKKKEDETKRRREDEEKKKQTLEFLAKKRAEEKAKEDERLREEAAREEEKKRQTLELLAKKRAEDEAREKRRREEAKKADDLKKENEKADDLKKEKEKADDLKKTQEEKAKKDREDEVRKFLEERRHKEEEERAKQLKAEEDRKHLILSFVKQQGAIANTLPEYYDILDRVLNRPQDPTKYRELLTEFERIRSVVTKDGSDSSLRFSEDNGRLKIDIHNPDVLFVEFDKAMAYFLGFDDPIVRDSQTAPHKINIFGDVSVIYLYSDIVEPIIVGNKKTNLLSVIPCTGKHDSVVYYTVPNPRYVPLINSTIDSIRIELLTDMGDPIPFSWGTSIAVLHFKKLK